MCKSGIELNELINIQTGEKLDWSKVELLPENAMLKIRPDLWCEWDFEKNDELSFNIWKHTKASTKKVWWLGICGHEWEAKVHSRNNSKKPENCPYCSGKRVNSTNSLSSLNPEVSSQWHPDKNGDLTPHDVTCGSGRKVWWIGYCGHEWEAKISDRTKGNGCPYCANQKVLIGFNDIWTTNPDLAKLLANPKDGYRYTEGSGKKFNCKCSECGDFVMKVLSDIKRSRICLCKECSDITSLGETMMFNVLKFSNLSFIKEKTFKWSQGKRYDFYIQSLAMIIEVHGAQHYSKGFENMSGRTLEEEQENDRIKEKLAKQNGIEHYIVIDARKSDFDYINENIQSSILNKIVDFDKIRWDYLKFPSIKNYNIKKVNALWKGGVQDTLKISNILDLNRSTVTDYLKIGSKMGLSEYSTDFLNSLQKSPVVQLNINNNMVKIFDSISTAGKSLNKRSLTCISDCCKGKKKIAYGYRWMYKEDYDRYTEDQNKLS